MLALAIIDNILYDHQLFVRLIKGHTKRLTGINRIPAENLLVHPCNSGRCFQQPFTAGILPD
ncbi:hypothetical protein D3C75_1058730 [compost metagenome]